jgi:DNA repair protein RAD50
MLQLTQKKASLQFKALDNTLQTVNPVTGQAEALSYRCADIDKVVPSLMGVSKAVLENVIFVHQEESNWPLAEGQVLKKKFDDIFAATRYTKALEELRKLKTRQAQDAREMKLKIEHLKTQKDHAGRLKAEVEDNRKKAEVLQQEVNTLQAQLDVSPFSKPVVA